MILHVLVPAALKKFRACYLSARRVHAPKYDDQGIVRCAYEPPHMKRTFLLLLPAFLLLQSCSESPEQSPQYQQLAEDSRHMEKLLAEKDSTINSLFGNFNRISENLRTIRSKQGQLTQNGNVESDESVQDRIMNDIGEIDALLAENKALIERMRQGSKKNTTQIVELERALEELELSMVEKDSEIDAIKEELASTNSSLATLIAMYRDKTQLADMQRHELNTAYYAIGTAKELQDKGVLTKQGGFAGIGKVEKLNTGSLGTDHFTRIDILESQEIPILGKKARLVTSHPDGSYRMEGDGNRLVITNADSFWSISKYLVVVVD